MIYTAKTQLIRVKINRHNYDKMCHVQSKPVKKLIKAILLINLGQMSLAQLVFFTSADKTSLGSNKLRL